MNIINELKFGYWLESEDGDVQTNGGNPIGDILYLYGLRIAHSGKRMYPDLRICWRRSDCSRIEISEDRLSWLLAAAYIAKKSANIGFSGFIHLYQVGWRLKYHHGGIWPYTLYKNGDPIVDYASLPEIFWQLERFIAGG